jgi:hypothetical protein
VIPHDATRGRAYWSRNSHNGSAKPTRQARPQEHPAISRFLNSASSTHISYRRFPFYI